MKIGGHDVDARSDWNARRLAVLLVASWTFAVLPFATTRSMQIRTDMRLHKGSASNSAAPSVQLRNGAKPGSLEITATRATHLASKLIVERELANGAFEAVGNLDLGSMKLVKACGEPIKACVQVGSEGLHPVAWSGMSCSSQCHSISDKNVRLHGSFRYVVVACDGHARFYGPVFTLPDAT